jgi:hypothetical protein
VNLYRLSDWILGGVVALGVVALLALALLPNPARADMGTLLAMGGTYATYADVSVPTTCLAIVPSRVDQRVQLILQNTGATNAARCGTTGGNVSSTLGTLLPVNGVQVVLNTSAAVTCCAAASTTTISATEILR